MIDVSVRDENLLYAVNLPRWQKRNVAKVEQECALLEEHLT